MFLKITKKLILCSAMISVASLLGCSESESVGDTSPVVQEADLFKNISSFETDEASRVLTVPASVDSLVVGSFASLGGSQYYLALDGDLVDPEIDWDHKLVDGSVISLKDSDSANIVVMDEASRVLYVWQIKKDVKAESSSSVAESSSSEIQSSSSVEESSSSIAESSSSVEESSSSVEKVPATVSEISIPETSVNVEKSKIVIEVPYGTDLKKIPLVPGGKVFDLTRPVEMELENEEGEIVTYSVVAGTQLPGSDFSARNDFWGTTSDAMAVSGKGTYIVSISVHSTENAVFENSKLTLTTQSVTGTGLGIIDGGWKMAGGFYFAGTYSGTDAASIYVADNNDAGADNRPANFSQYMTHGKPFTARPTGFEVTYSYVHKDNTNDTYPQSSLIYVVLVSADNKVIAAAYINDFESVDSETKNVTLTYGSDAGLLSSGFVGTADLEQGNGDEEVASIRVMFASSTLAYVADGGTSSQMKKNFRGAEGAKLIVDDFKLVY